MKVVSDKKCELYNREHRIVTTHTLRADMSTQVVLYVIGQIMCTPISIKVWANISIPDLTEVYPSIACS